MLKTKWTPENEKFLVENYKMMTAKEIAEKLGYTVSQVRNKAFKLGLKKSINGKKLVDYSQSKITASEVSKELFSKNGNGSCERVKKIDFGVSLEEALDYLSKEEYGKASDVQNLLKLLEEQNNKQKATDLTYSERSELIKLYSKGISCAQTSAALLYNIFRILNEDGKKVNTVLDIGGAHGSASIKAKQEFGSDLELTILDMDVEGVKRIDKKRYDEEIDGLEIKSMALPYDNDFQDEEKYDLITATYFFCELTPEEIKQTINQLPESKYFFATMPPSKQEKTETLINALSEKYKVRYGLFKVKLNGPDDKLREYTVYAIGGTKA